MKKFIKQINPFNNYFGGNNLLYTIKILLKTFLTYFASLLVGETLIIIISMFCGYNATTHQLPYNTVLLVSFYGYIVTILFFILLIKVFSKKKLNDYGLNKKVFHIFKGILLGIGSLGLIIGILLITKGITFHGINKDVSYLYIVLYFFAYLIQGLMEELVCRGYLFHQLKQKLPIVVAGIISILFFSIFHFSKLFDAGFVLGLIGSLNLILVSVIWLILTIKNNNIYTSVGFHFIWNFILFNIIGLNLSGLEATTSLLNFSANSKFLTGSSYGLEASIITSGILGIILVVLIILNKKKANSK